MLEDDPIVTAAYCTEREFGVREPAMDIINEPQWAALCSLIRVRLGDGSFGLRFPEQCLDGNAPCGCDEQAFFAVLAAEVPNLKSPYISSELPSTPVILDLLEFCAKAVGEPVQGEYHSYYRHHHLRWDREAGLRRFVADINLLFQRNALAFEFSPTGRVSRRFSAPLAVAIGCTLFQTGDSETDQLLEDARRRILSPKQEDRQDALEKLWDAFERLKTLEPGSNKRAQADALLDRVAAPGSAFRQALACEAIELTSIGNSFRIRHSEVTQEALTSSDQIDYLFTRMFAFVQIVLRRMGRGK